MMRRLIAVIIILVLLVISITAYSFYFPTSKNIGVNVCLHLADYNNTTLANLRDLKVSWVRTDWIFNETMDAYCQDLQKNDINLLTIIDTNTFDFQNFTLSEWKSNVTAIATSPSFQTVDAVEIWNEPNGQAYLAPELYYQMLKDAYVIIKNYSSVPVVFAGVSPNILGWQAYLCQTFHADIEMYFDYIGIHLYDDAQINQQTLDFIKSLTDKPIWVTETGKPSINDDQIGQSSYIYSVYSNIKSQVSQIFIYELNDNSGLMPEKENYFGLLDLNGTKKQAYDMVYYINRQIS